MQYSFDLLHNFCLSVPQLFVLQKRLCLVTQVLLSALSQAILLFYSCDDDDQIQSNHDEHIYLNALFVAQINVKCFSFL
jgi:hypothetical protein